MLAASPIHHPLTRIFAGSRVYLPQGKTYFFACFFSFRILSMEACADLSSSTLNR